ncbi:Hint domain-containing protein [Tropicimonas marinistellae]|uniref:Hint domain-containing protein n=1 Tax=Tropicimonas marinistellae TaxID=1739787 RepID=UPI00082A6F5C|nr:Hint domain-containing protein [Tropicimonas marinistellae]
MDDGTTGAYVISWAQTAIDDVAGAPAGELRAGATWRWVGQAMRIDRPGSAAVLSQPIGAAELHARAAQSARRLCAPVVPLAAPAGTDIDDDQLLDRGFVVTDGRRAFSASRIEASPGQPALVLFHGTPPPQGEELWIVRVVTNRRAEARAERRPAPPVTGFVAGTRLLTPNGPRLVDALRPGDSVLTRDAGPCVLRARSVRRVTAADMTRAPGDRPLRLSSGAFGIHWAGPAIRIGWDQHVLIGGAAVHALFGAREVLVRAGDLQQQQGVSLDLDAAEVVYVRLLLDQHQILLTQGPACESFHPDMASAPGEGLLDIGAGLRTQLGADVLASPDSYGPPARRRLSRAEAALLSAGGDLRAVA